MQMGLRVMQMGKSAHPTRNQKVSSLEVSAFTRVAPKVLATFATNLLPFDAGQSAFGFSIVNLTRSRKEPD